MVTGSSPKSSHYVVDLEYTLGAPCETAPVEAAAEAAAIVSVRPSVVSSQEMVGSQQLMTEHQPPAETTQDRASRAAPAEVPSSSAPMEVPQ